MIYTALKQGMNQLYIRELNELEPRLIAESRLSDFINPRLSPENTWIAYYLEQENTIQIVPTQGGPSQQVITNTSGSWGWLDETTLLFSDAGFELTRIDIGTGETTPVELQIQDNEYPLWVHALPDQKGLLFTCPSSNEWNRCSV